MNAIINRLDYSFNHAEIDKAFDIFQITTSQKFIPDGAYQLDKPIEKLNALSVLFEPKSKSAFVLYKKNTISCLKFQEALESDDIIVNQIASSKLKDYLLLRLFVNALGSYSSVLSFNNLTGRLFITDGKWIRKKHDILKAMELVVTKNMGLEAHAVTFTNTKNFTSKQIKGLPRYTLGGANFSLKRITAVSDEDETFVIKSKYGYKSNIDFLTFDDKKDSFLYTRSYRLYKILDLLNTKYAQFLAVKFKEQQIDKTISSPSEKHFMDEVIMNIRFNDIYIVNYDQSEEGLFFFNGLHVLLEKALGDKMIDLAKDPVKNALNIVFLHNEAYYLEKEIDDPYKKLDRSVAIQCVTTEDCDEAIAAGDPSVISTILKELLIKSDILYSKRITLDDWSKLGFKGNYTFGCLEDDTLYFIMIDPQGHFDCFTKAADFSEFKSDELNELTNELLIDEMKGKIIIKDDKGNVNLIGRTDLFTLPRKEIFSAHGIRGKEERPRYLSGVTDINFYETNEESFYNVGVIGNGMQSKIAKASRLYQVKVIKGENIVRTILPLMSVTFVKLNEFTVLPYPFKYLREFIAIQKNEKE